MNFYNFVKTPLKTVDKPEKVWHSIQAPQTADAKRTLTTENV
jgi:hypothetical protein